MKARSALTLIELLVILIVALVLFSFLTPSLTSSHGPSHRARCSNNLRQIGVAAFVYASDYRFFPHMTDLEQSHSPEQVSAVYRRLIHLKYFDSPQALICPGSMDSALPLEEGVIKNPKSFRWGSVDSAVDPSVFENSQLSYTYRKRRLKLSSVRSDTLLSADKALRRSEHPRASGNHREGFNILLADGHVRYARVTEDPMITQRLTEGLVMNSPGR